MALIGYVQRAGYHSLVVGERGISQSARPLLLWPANHSMYGVKLNPQAIDHSSQLQMVSLSVACPLHMCPPGITPSPDVWRYLRYCRRNEAFPNASDHQPSWKTMKAPPNQLSLGVGRWETNGVLMCSLHVTLPLFAVASVRFYRPGPHVRMSSQLNYVSVNISRLSRGKLQCRRPEWAMGTIASTLSFRLRQLTLDDWIYAL